MTANKNEPDKKPASSASAQASARPHATLDLKATEVTPPPAKPEPGKPEVAEASAKAAASSAAAAPSTSAAGAGSAKPAAASSAAGAKDTKPAGTPPPSSPPSRPAPRGYGGFFTHVAAGLSGGIVALLAADILAQQLGFQTADRPEQVTALEQRLAAVEGNRPAHRTARCRQSPRCRRNEARQARAARRQHRRHLKEAGPARRGPQRDQRQDRHRQRRHRQRGAHRQAGGAAVADVVGRRARSAERAPAAARRDHRQARRSGIDVGQSARRAAQERRHRDRHALGFGHRGRPDRPLRHAAHGSRALDAQGRERRDVDRPHRAQDRQRPRGGQPQDHAGGDQAPQGRSRHAARHLRQARGRLDRRGPAQRQAGGAAAGRAGRHQERGRSPHHRRAHRAVAGARQPQARHRPRQCLRTRAGAGAQGRRHQRRPGAAGTLRARRRADADRAARAVQADRLQDHRRRRAARRRLDRRPPAGRRLIGGARAQDGPQPRRQEHRSGRRPHGSRTERGPPGRRAAGGEVAARPGAGCGPGLPRQGAGARRRRPRARLRRNPAQGIARHRARPTPTAKPQSRDTRHVASDRIPRRYRSHRRRPCLAGRPSRRAGDPMAGLPDRDQRVPRHRAAGRAGRRGAADLVDPAQHLVQPGGRRQCLEQAAAEARHRRAVERHDRARRRRQGGRACAPPSRRASRCPTSR